MDEPGAVMKGKEPGALYQKKSKQTSQNRWGTPFLTNTCCFLPSVSGPKFWLHEKRGANHVLQ